MDQNETDATRALQAAGVNLDALSAEQRQVLASLTPEEVSTLLSIEQRVNDAADVQSYRAGDVNGGVIL